AADVAVGHHLHDHRRRPLAGSARSGISWYDHRPPTWQGYTDCVAGSAEQHLPGSIAASCAAGFRFGCGKITTSRQMAAGIVWNAPAASINLLAHCPGGQATEGSEETGP